MLVLHFDEQLSSDSSHRDEFGQYGCIVGIDSHAPFIVGVEEIILDVLYIFPLEDDELCLAFRPRNVLEFGVVMHIVVEAYGDDFAIESESDGKFV